MNHHIDHCDHCFKINCKYEACKLIECERIGCKFKMHECKKDDHRLICQRERVHCINCLFGCSQIMFREELKSHLVSCPASTVACSFEYNRWPLHTREKRLNNFNDQFNYRERLLEDLDTSLNVALAYRDQEMLGDLEKYKKMKRLFRNNLTKKYPPVPIGPYLSSSKILNLQTNQSTDDQPLIRSNSLTKCSSFVSTTSQTTSTISDDDSDSPWMHHKNPSGLSKSVLNKLSTNPTTSLTNLIENQTKESIKENNNKIFEEEHTISSSISDSSTDNEQQNVNSKCKIKKSKKKRSTQNKLQNKQLIVDLNIEFIAHHQIKPKSMFSFRCGSDFRRDEFCMHYQNVHSDIMGGLNDWMEKRCPLAQYNCNFFVRRIHPVFNGRKTKIIFSQLNKSFGHLIESNDTEIINNQNLTHLTDRSINLTDLPLELLSHIISYLDAFSLNNLSLTNKLLRRLVSNHLERKGIVSLFWQKVKKSETTNGWVVVGYQWKFSNSFDQISSWKFENDNKLLNHIKNCKHYDKLIRNEPYKLIGLVREDD